MSDGSNLTGQPSGAGPHQYHLVDRAGRPRDATPQAQLILLIRQGRIFRSDLIVKNGRDAQPLGSVREFAVVFDEVNPATPRFDALRATPEFAGEADPLSLARAFVRIFRERQNGRLFVCANGAREEKVVTFRDGVPVNATSNIKGEWLGQVLRNQGLIDQSTFNEALQATEIDGPRLGEVLVGRDKISARQLYRALAIQAMDRLLKLFQRGGTYHFVIDQSVAEEEILLLAGPRDVLETCLAAALAPQKVTESLAEHGDPMLSVNVPADLADELNDGDRTVLELLKDTRALSEQIPRVAEALRLTTAEARGRILFLMLFDCVSIGDPAQKALDALLHKYQGQNYFSMLEVRLGSLQDEIDEAYAARMAELAEIGQGRSSRTGDQISTLLAKASAVLNDPEQRPLYERAQQMGIDFDQPSAKARLQHEMLLERGKGLIAQQSYVEAATVLKEAAALTPDDAETESELGWAQFLSGSRAGSDAADAKKRVERGINLAPGMPRGHLLLGKIERMLGDKVAAEACFRKVLELNPKDRDADAEIRGLNAIDSTRTRPGLPRQRVAPRAVIAIAISLAVTGLLYAGANLISGGPELWPETSSQALEVKADLSPRMMKIAHGQRLRLLIEPEKLTEAALRLGAEKSDVPNTQRAINFLVEQDFRRVIAMIRSLREIPPDEQVLGSVEYHYPADDGWWWTRRGTLLVIGLLCFFLVGRERLSTVTWIGDHHNLLFLAPVYGIAIGIFSGVPDIASSGGAAFGMTMFQVLAEQVFFIWFLARTLNSTIEIPAVGALITGLLYGVYQLSYVKTIANPIDFIFVDVLQLSVFAVGAYALFAWRTRGILAPLLAHAAVNGTMMVRAML